MKKTKKAAAKKRVYSRAAAHKSARGPVAFYRRIFIFGSFAVVLAIIIAIPNKTALHGAVEGAKIQFGQFDQQVITLPPVPNAVTYNIYYRTSVETEFSNAVRNLPATMTTYTINYLTPNQSYVYKVTAKDNTGKEIFWAPSETIVASHPM